MTFQTSAQPPGLVVSRTFDKTKHSPNTALKDYTGSLLDVVSEHGNHGGGIADHIIWPWNGDGGCDISKLAEGPWKNSFELSGTIWRRLRDGYEASVYPLVFGKPGSRFSIDL